MKHWDEEKNRHRLQTNFAEYIAKRCMTGDIEADHLNADKAIIKYLETLGCLNLVEAWKNVEKWYA